MTQRRVFGVLLMVAVLGLVGTAAEKAPEDYQKAMKDLGAFNAGIDKAVMAADYATVSTLAMSARAGFEVSQKYWAGKNADAAELARLGAQAAGDLGVWAKLMNQQGAAIAVKDAKQVCGTCHMAHRERMPDGTFGIK